MADSNLIYYRAWVKEINGHIDYQLEAGRSYELVFRGHKVREIALREPSDVGIVRLLCGLNKETEYAIFIPLAALEVELHQAPRSTGARVGFIVGGTEVQIGSDTEALAGQNEE